MTWYAAHIVLYVKLKRGRQDRFPVWENIVLIRAADDEEAFEKAEEWGRAEAGDDDGTFRWGGQLAVWVFAGVRKVVACADPTSRPGDGDEVSYNELELASQEAIAQLVAGSPTKVTLRDRFSPHAGASNGAAGSQRRTREKAKA